MASSERRNERPIEQPAVKTTIVGGRPPGPGKQVGTIPRGIEVLVKKASVDAEFRALLLEKRGEAAREIGLELEPAETAMLGAVPAAQLAAIIAQTTVSPMSRAAFLGKAAAVMLAALGAGAGCDDPGPITGARVDRPPEPGTKGITADRPAKEPPKTATPASKPKTEAPAAKLPEQPMVPVAGVAPRPIERDKTSSDPPVTKGTRPDRP